MNSWHRFRRLLAVLAFAAAAPVCAAEAKLTVVASFSILADLVRQVGGDDVAVTSLVGPDGDVHVFEPAPRHAKALQQAQVLVVNGLRFESWMPRLKRSAGFKGLEVVASEGVRPRVLRSHSHAHGGADRHRRGPGNGHDHDHGEHDPHAWQNVANVVIYVENIAKGLARADPARADAYRARARAYSERLKALDARIRSAVDALPPERRSVVTTHDAFGYYADAYGLRFVAARGMTSGAEPSARDIARLIDQVRRQHIPAVFIENIADPRLVEQLARETGAAVGGKLYSDALSPAGGPAAGYVELMQANTAALIEALSPPAAARR